jgi:hypothetical protein
MVLGRLLCLLLGLWVVSTVTSPPLALWPPLLFPLTWLLGLLGLPRLVLGGHLFELLVTLWLILLVTLGLSWLL